jgi:hypothetical protein
MEEKKYVFSIQEVGNMFVAIVKNREMRAIEKIFNVNESGGLILKALQGGNDKSAIVNLLISEFDIQPEEAEHEVNTFIDMLREKGLAE